MASDQAINRLTGVVSKLVIVQALSFAGSVGLLVPNGINWDPILVMGGLLGAILVVALSLVFAMIASRNKR